MSRPEYPRCIMPVEVIRSIRQEQDYYDQDPERYEREQRTRKEERQLEQQREHEEYRGEYE